MKRDIHRRIAEELRSAATPGTVPGGDSGNAGTPPPTGEPFPLPGDEIAAGDIAAIRERLEHFRACTRPGTVGSGAGAARRDEGHRRPVWATAAVAAMAVLALVPVFHDATGDGTRELSRVVQPVLRLIPSETKFDEQILFVLDATSSYYRGRRREE